MASTRDIVQSLIIVSEKAARLARICRQNGHLLSLLVEEKKDDEKNSRFLKDFKTLADVLVQELIKYEMEKKFPELKNSVFGEENNTFTNTIGESVTVVLDESKNNTESLLRQVLNGDEEAAYLLAETIHSSVSIEDVPACILPDDGPDLNLVELALWIDPIDSTAEYIYGGDCNRSASVSLNGLKCVTVLIGVFNRNTGTPLIGVISQPFHSFEDNKWIGRAFWGISIDHYNRTSVLSKPSTARSDELVVAISSNESASVKKKLERAGFTLIPIAGAGYKILCVILDLVDAYVLSQGTTYQWDTCGSHAILKGLKGNIWNYEKALSGNLSEISYRVKTDDPGVKQYSNRCGIIACKDEILTRRIIAALR